MQIVITGTSRGIGLELARIALGRGHEVVAVARRPAAAADLLQLQGEFPARLRLVEADLRQPGAADTIAAALDWTGVDVLLNNAGILLESASREDFMESFLVNTVAPYEITRALLSRLKLSTNPRAVHLTSRMGSIAENTAGGHYAYRASKAALNMISRSLARDQPWLTTAVVHPGWVRTRMGGAEAPVPPPTAAGGIWRLVEGLQTASSGRFFDYQGKELPW